MKRSIALVFTVALLAGADAALAGGSHGGHFHSGGSVVGHVGASSGGSHSHPGSGHFHHHGRVIVGSTIFLGGLGYPYYYYPPPPVYAAPPAYAEEPITYIEQAPAAQQQVYYYCPDLRAYYPNVTTCPSAWLKVVP